MKKITTTFLLIISILGGLFTLSSCEKKITKNDEAVEEMITEDYIQFYWSDLPTGKTDYMYIKYFLGIYDNLYVATFYDYNLPGRPHTDIVGGVSFVYSESGTRTVVWKNHKFFELNEAYEKGLFSLEQIETIHKEYLRYEWPEEIKNML
ncbi:MAG: hypothetical protein K2N65_01135, partial [Anaeroplasmataceae bacterium]|nr:hypothetical protein [Anaeroplasmataceae bacterium]